MVNMNTRNVNAAGKVETISTSRKINNAIEVLRRRHFEANQRFLALEERLKALTNSDIAYVSVNGVSMPVPHI